MRGQRFGRLLAVDRVTATKPSGQKYSLWRCKCDCGAEAWTSLSDLKSRNTTSCGCAHHTGDSSRTHGMTRTRVHSIWAGMRKRCRDHERYAGRGIKVCERWESFECFFEDMGIPPRGTSLDRINNDGPYSPENCRWATPAQQRRNCRRVVNVTINGETMCLQDWCNRLGRPYHRTYARIKTLGWSPERALEVTP